MEHGTTARLGVQGESLAADWLRQRGYRIVERNWRCARGEVDIVAWDGDTLVFVEVKTRAGAATGHPFESITATKLTRLRRLVPAWFDDHPDVSARAVRIDAVAVHVDGPRSAVELVVGVL
ncbi:YraN family protein [Curtobacterium luteum]|uniref:YraN family protein n=1 Tax=Curtobacterium luteum TaxID=33881 RepID=UPI0037F44FCC